MIAMNESRKSAQTDKARKRFSISNPPIDIWGMDSQYHPRGRLSSQPTFVMSGTNREPIEIKIERTCYEKKKLYLGGDQLDKMSIEKNEQNKKIKDMFRKKGKEEVRQGVCKWMVHARISFVVTKNLFFQNMCDTIAKAGLGICGPDPYQLIFISPKK